jgi:hypothetical protein
LPPRGKYLKRQSVAIKKQILNFSLKENKKLTTDVEKVKYTLASDMASAAL